MTNKILFLGPEGSYSNKAMKKFIEHYSLHNYTTEPIESIYMIIKTLCKNNNNLAVIPIENSIEGIVRDTQDSLSKLLQHGYKIFAETTLSIEHALVGFGKKEDVKKITSHPQALAQCREYIYKNYENNVNLLPVMSTSGAIKLLNKNNIETAAIGSEYCAKRVQG